MILCVTTVKRGAMPQFTIQLAESLIHNGQDAKLCAPISDDITVPFENKNVHRFSLPSSSVGKQKAAHELAEYINTVNPKQVWVGDETFTSLILVTKLNKSIDVKFFVHDAKPHVYSRNIKRMVRFKIFQYMRKCVFKRADNLVFMSKSSMNTFLENYDYPKEKMQLLRLGAHVPQQQASIPPELNENKEYFMFFGAIEKYKNVKGLLAAYKLYHGRRKLVIAGRGQLTEEEKKLLEEIGKDRVILINRFITDGEMIALFERAWAVVLPYIEASQSGVLSMAYYFSKPVIVTNLPGLTEFVEDGKTGWICKDTSDMARCLEKADDSTDYLDVSGAAKNYSQEYLNFDRNVKYLLESGL